MRRLSAKDEIIIGFQRTIGAAPVLLAIYGLAHLFGAL